MDNAVCMLILVVLDLILVVLDLIGDSCVVFLACVARHTGKHIVKVVEESVPEAPEQVEEPVQAVEEPAPAASEKTEEPVTAFKDPTPDEDDFREVVSEKEEEEDFREVSVESEIQQFFDDAKKAVMLDPQEPAIPEIDIDKNGTGLVFIRNGHR